MEITRRCDYACRILRAAYERGDSFISIADVAERENIPYSFARSIQHDLVKEGYLKTNRGARGGLTLACDPSKTTLLDLLTTMKGAVSMAPCADPGFVCEHKEDCVFNCAWVVADSLVHALFSSITLADLFEYGSDHPAFKKALSLKSF